MCHNSQSVVFNEHLLGPRSPGCLLECGAGRLAGRWKSAAPSPGGHVPLIVRCDRRSLAVKKLRIPALASAPAVSGFPKLCCRRLHRARRRFFFKYRPCTYAVCISIWAVEVECPIEFQLAEAFFE